MSKNKFKFLYGPVPSRRLGRSLGVDLVPYKTCTYDCVYCQLGCTTNKTTERREYVPGAEIMKELKEKLSKGDAPDVITLAGSGEPTLNMGIGDLIGGIKKLTTIPVAVLTNGSLLWMREVRDALMDADLVLPSLDAGDEFMFRYVNRPHESLLFERVVDGMAEFTARFRGEIWLEVLLLGGVTGVLSEVDKIAKLIRHINPARIQLNTATRPPAESFVMPMPIGQLNDLRQVFSGNVDIIMEREMNSSCQPSGPAGKSEVLALIARRPCRPEDVAKGLGLHLNEALKLLDVLTASGEIGRVVTSSGIYYTTRQVKNKQGAK